MIIQTVACEACHLILSTHSQTILTAKVESESLIAHNLFFEKIIGHHIHMQTVNLGPTSRCSQTATIDAIFLRIVD